MIIWERTSEGYIECFVDNWYGVVGLADARTGWTARLEHPRGSRTAPLLFNTSGEAKLWIERQIQERRCEPGALRAFTRPLRITAPALPLHRAVRQAVAWAIVTYQHWNALYLDPRRYDQGLSCCASC